MGGGSVKRTFKKATKAFIEPITGSFEEGFSQVSKLLEPDIPGSGDDTIEAITPAGAPIEEATLKEFSDEELEAKKRKAKKSGTKSLQIPLGGIGGAISVGK